MPSAWAVNQALSLDGDGDYVEIANSPSLNPTNQITVEAWYKPTVSFKGRGNDPIVGKPYTSHSSPFYQYQLSMSGDMYPSSSQGTFAFQVSISNMESALQLIFGNRVTGIT